VTKQDKLAEFREQERVLKLQRDQLDELIEDTYRRIDKLEEEIEFEKSHTYNQV
jgi:vacuolar-type H+-ATPase subunit D/Vma8